MANTKNSFSIRLSEREVGLVQKFIACHYENGGNELNFSEGVRRMIVIAAEFLEEESDTKVSRNPFEQISLANVLQKFNLPFTHE